MTTVTRPWQPPGEGEATPRQIVSWLHALIAGRSPEHARLVRRFEARQALLDAQQARLDAARRPR